MAMLFSVRVMHVRFGFQSDRIDKYFVSFVESVFFFCRILTLHFGVKFVLFLVVFCIVYSYCGFEYLVVQYHLHLLVVMSVVWLCFASHILEFGGIAIYYDRT